MKMNKIIAVCLALTALAAVSASAASLSTDRLGTVLAGAENTYWTITQPKVVTTASSTLDNSFYVEDVGRSAAIKVFPVSVTLKVVPGDRVNLAGPVFADSNGNMCFRGVTVTKTSGSAVGPLGVTNSRLYVASPVTKRLFVRTWGKVGFIAGDGDYFYINDGTTELGVRVVLQSSIGSVAQTAIRGQYVSVCGLVDSVADLTTPDDEICPVINVRSAADITVISSAPSQPYPLGLTVNNGVLVRNGAPFRGVGVDFIDPFISAVDGMSATGNGTHTMTYRESFQTLNQLNIKFCRISAWDFWPKTPTGPGNSLYITDKDSFFHELDDVFRAAEDNGIGMIPSVFFSESNVVDLVTLFNPPGTPQESMDQWGNVNSGTIALMKQFVQDYIGHYQSSPSLWGYEFANEFNLSEDIHGSQFWPSTWTDLGEPATRSSADELTGAQCRTAFAQFGAAVRLYDTNRIIVSGNGEPRPSEYNLNISGGTSWTEDTLAQMDSVLLADNPDPINTISLHTYDAVQSRFNTSVPVANWIADCKAEGDSVKKPIYVGEFGQESIQNATPAQDWTTSSNFYAILDAIQSQGASIAAVWCYDFPQYGTYDGWNVVPTNSRSWMLSAIQAVNAQI